MFYMGCRAVQGLFAEGVYMQQSIRKAAIYCRVSTADQNNTRQVEDLTRFAAARGFEVLSVYEEKASTRKDNRPIRAEVIQAAREGKINTIIITELSRWGRNREDLHKTLEQLADWGCSVICQTGMELDLSTPTGRMVLAFLAGVSQFERDLLRERTMSGLASARAAGRIGGRKAGFNPSDKHAKNVLDMVAAARTIRWIAHELQISTTTIMQIKKRNA